MKKAIPREGAQEYREHDDHQRRDCKPPFGLAFNEAEEPEGNGKGRRAGVDARSAI